ncbi:MAG: sigma-70 family RNA polymerase sigma factor [Candidatus Eisenbacteria sp.]|nr:sigma-70 family RNA polymerase sigma factor [Candidatus Eisenbacteria bacterium]
MSGPADDVALVRQCLKGDEWAFAKLVSLYSGVLYRLAWRMLRNEEEARDAVQEVFLRVYRALSSFDQSRKFSTWILRITTNHCIDRIRRRRIKMLSIDVADKDDTYLPVVLVDGRPTPEARYGRTALSETLDQMVLRLPPIYQAVVELRYKQQLAYSEIAEVLEIPLGTVKARLHRAHRQLKEKLQSSGIGPEALDL